MMNLLLVFFLMQDTPPEIKENIEVSLRQIQVRVQTRESEPIKGLKMQDFVLRRNGEVLIPESFIEVDESEPFADVGVKTDARPDVSTVPDESSEEAKEDGEVPIRRQKSVAILMDPGMSTVKGWQVIQKATSDLVDKLPPDTRVSLYQMHFSLRNLNALTANRDLVKSRIDEAEYFSDLWNKISSLQRSINMTAQELQTPRSRASEGMGSLSISMLNQLGEMLKFKGMAKDMHTTKIANALGAIGKSMAKAEGDRSIYLLTAGGYVDDTSVGMLKAVTSQLNWQNIPVHTLHFRDRETKDLNLVRMTRMTEEDLKELQQSLWRGGFIEEGNSVNTLNEDESYLKSSPRTMARETGGTFVSAFNPLQVDIQMGRILRGSSHYYLVSYKTAKKLDNVEISLKQPIKGADVFYGRDRGTFVKQFSESKKEKNLDFATTLLYGFEHHDTEISWEFEHFVNADGTHSFPVVGRLTGEFPDKGYELGMIALDDKGEIMDDRKSEIRAPGKGGQTAFYDLLVTVEKPMLIRAMIREKKSGKSSLAEFEVGKNLGDGASLSTLVMIPTEKQDVFAIHALQKERVKLRKKKKVARQKMDPLFKGPSKMIPPYAGAFPKGKPVGLYFHAQNIEGAINNYDLETVLHHEGKTYPVGLQIGKVEAVKAGAALMASIDTSRLPGGRYVLAMRLKDKRTGELSPFTEQPFEVR